MLGQRLGKASVQPGPLARQQFRVQRLLGQRVPEGVGLGGRVGDEHLVGDRGTQRRHQVRFGQLADRRQQLGLHRSAGRGHQSQCRLRVLGKVLDAAQQDVLQTRGQAPPAALVGRGQQLLREERVALRPAVDPLDQARRPA